MKMLFMVLFMVFCKVSGDCSLEPPIKGDGPGVGLIFVPGAKIAGEAYLPLLRSIQEFYPEPLWVGATTAWLGDMPNPIEIGGQIQDCLSAAENLGLDTAIVFYGGHSLGGIVLESYIAGHAEIAQGIFLLGTWLPDLLRGDNEFPVPVLTAIGELDGGGLSYLTREWEQTQALSEETRKLTKTILVPQVNHAQVASGEAPESVIDNDIDGELSEEEAHRNYAVRVGDWLNLNSDSSNKLTAETNFAEYEQETGQFLQPFLEMQAQESSGSFSPFSESLQLRLLEVAVSDNLVIEDEVVQNAASFQIRQPGIYDDTQSGLIRVETLTHFFYDLDILDFNNHLSASTMKTKLKSADSIYSALMLPELGQFLSCSELNKMSLEMAVSASSPTALLRMHEKGRNLTFIQDKELGWGGIGWELTGSLEWVESSPGSVTLQSTRLTSEVDFPLFPGVHYCDVLSPYRALEWIYIESLRHVMHF